MEIRKILVFATALLTGIGVWAQSFTEREVQLQIVQEYEHDTMQLAGTLTMPIGVTEKVPAVILITGSGTQNRDEEIMGHKPFKVIAEYLSARGYAVLRCDDRGVGESTGDMAHATTLDFAHDIDHLLMYLQSPRSVLDIDPNRIYLFGHSEGATVAAIVAAKNRYTLNPVAGVAMLGGAGVDGRTLLLQQNEAIFRLQGLEDSLIVRRLACMRELFAVCDTLSLGKGIDTVKTINLAFRPLFKKYSEGLTKEQKQRCGLTTGDCYGWAVTVATPWMRTFLSLDPTEYIAQMRCPLLAIGGEKDCQVPADANLSVIENICEANGIPCQTIRLPDVNHLGQVCHTGAVDEYATLGQAPDESVLSALVQWLDSISSQSERTKN
jgi:pimeloyl-ACP methyl ester carboxylesterase